MFIAALFIIAKIRSISRRINKLWYIHTGKHNIAYKSVLLLPRTLWINLTNIILSQKKKKDKQKSIC